MASAHTRPAEAAGRRLADDLGLICPGPGRYDRVIVIAARTGPNYWRLNSGVIKTGTGLPVHKMGGGAAVGGGTRRVPRQYAASKVELSTED